MTRASWSQNEKDLNVINRQLGLPTGWVKGALSLGGAYGGQRVEQIVSDGGAIKALTGYCTAREIGFYISGMSDALDLAEKQGFEAPTPPTQEGI